MPLLFFIGGEIGIRIADESVIVLHPSLEVGYRTYHRCGESVEMIFDELGYDQSAFKEVPQEEYDKIVKKYRELLPF